jgi:type I restriction enzyme S subunit
MEVKPGYKQTEVGVIPEEWDCVKLGKFISLQRGYDLTWRERQQGDVPVMGSAGQNGVHNVAIAKGPGLVIGRSGASFGQVHFCARDFWPHNTALYVTDFRGNYPLFVFYYLKSIDFSRHNSGGAQQSLNRNFIFPIVIGVPRLREQRVIAEALSDVDALLGGLDRLIAKKRDLKQAAMQQLLSGQTRLPGFQNVWEKKTLGQLFNFSGGYSASREQLSNFGHCYLHYGDIHKSSKSFVDVGAEYQDIPKLNISLRRVSASTLLEDGDVVFVDASEDEEGASRHVIVINKERVPFIAGLHTIVAKPKSRELAHEYQRYCFQTSAVRQQFLFYAVGTKVSGISKANIAKLTLLVPGISEQNAIAEVLTDMDTEIAALEQRREKTRALKQAMMQELLTGKTRLI